METVRDLIFLGSKITADCESRHAIKRHLFLERKAITNIDSILKSKDTTLLTKFHIVKPIVLPVVMYGLESWTIRKVERQIIDAFELWCWSRLLRVPLISRKSNLSILKEISPEYSLEGLVLRLQYFGHLMWRVDSLEKTLMLRKIEARRRRWWQRTRSLDGNTDSVDMSLRKLQCWWWTGKTGVLQSMGLQRVGHDRATEQQRWTHYHEFKYNPHSVISQFFLYAQTLSSKCMYSAIY